MVPMTIRVYPCESVVQSGRADGDIRHGGLQNQIQHAENSDTSFSIQEDGLCVYNEVDHMIIYRGHEV